MMLLLLPLIFPKFWYSGNLEKILFFTDIKIIILILIDYIILLFFFIEFCCLVIDPFLFVFKYYVVGNEIELVY